MKLKMIRHYIFLPLILFLGFIRVTAQNLESKKQVYKNAWFLEAGGHGVFYSLNYERLFFNKGNITTSMRFGITPCFSRNLGYTFGKGGQLFGLFNCIIGRDKSKLEIGIGVDNHFNFYPEITGEQSRKGYSDVSPYIYSKPPLPPYNFDITSHISFRHEINNKKLFIRVSFICFDFFDRNGKGNIEQRLQPWWGVSFGKMF